MVELPLALAAGGFVEEAVATGDAFAALDTADAPGFARDVALILARAGRADEARGRVDAGLRSHADDTWAQINAGDVHGALGDVERAERALRRALAIAQRHGSDEDADAAHALRRLHELLAAQPDRERDAADLARDLRRAERAAYDGPRVVVVTAGRNDPCPCGSGRKYKRCCGA
jgi:tetratricopeptide (TPR) repeat protein